MNDEIAKEIAAHLSGVKLQLTAIKWLMVVAVLAMLALAWFASHPAPAFGHGGGY